ncbi:hypothetical protein RRG08_024585 [Elysia crispata]|uniref:Uncharacterized protein n=1 Tax=Elysia crispata TaxID=231223 RepID=A0AAE0ZWV8_9GAST|nr:hypothetical protein RRG08_024585 [Elysia crispata]
MYIWKYDIPSSQGYGLEESDTINLFFSWELNLDPQPVALRPSKELMTFQCQMESRLPEYISVFAGPYLPYQLEPCVRLPVIYVSDKDKI